MGKEGVLRGPRSDTGGVSETAAARSRVGGRFCAVAGNRLIPRAGPEPPRALSPPGDALLALWKVERRQLKNFITVVIKCSLEIHGLFEAQEVEEGLDVRVKIGELLWRRDTAAVWCGPHSPRLSLPERKRRDRVAQARPHAFNSGN